VKKNNINDNDDQYWKMITIVIVMVIVMIIFVDCIDWLIDWLIMTCLLMVNKLLHYQ
jgi:preprotein translocase SecE subunit